MPRCPGVSASGTHEGKTMLERFTKSPTLVGAGLLLALLVIGWAAGAGSDAPAMRQLPSPEEALTMPFPRRDAPGAVETAGGLPRAVVAFAAPDGAVLGPVEAGRAFTFISAIDGWLFLDIEGSGRVWVRASDLSGTPFLPTY